MEYKSPAGGLSYSEWFRYEWVGPSAMQSGPWRQMEKERMREQIIGEEIERRRILEAEVRRELLFERAAASSIYTPPPLNTFTSHFLPPSDTLKRLFLQAKPEANISGMKRKAEVFSSVSVRGLTSSTDTALKKKVKEEWACALCEVSATSERALLEHRQGKRHKAKEAGLKKNGKNFSIGLFPKKNLMPNKVLGIPSSPSLQKGLIPAEANSENAETNNYQAISGSPQLDKTVKKNKAPDRRTGSRKRRNFKFWCEMCQVGAFSETVMETHRKGKKHLARLPEQNTVGTPPAQITLQEMNLTEEASEVVEGNASRDSAPFVDKVKLDCYQKEAGEDEDNIQSKGLGVVADEVELEGNQNEAEKDEEDTTSGSLVPVTVVVKLEGEKKECCQDDVEDTKSEGSDLASNE